MAEFERVKPRFWDESSDHGVEAPLTDAALAEAEAKLGVRLPAAFVELLRVRNGGNVAREFRRFPVRGTSWAEDHVGFEDVRGIGPELLDNAYYTSEWEMPPELVLLTGDGHWWIALDYRRPGEPAVTWYDNELGQDVRLADDFRAFVEGLELEPAPEFDYVQPPVKDFGRRVKSPISGKIESLRTELERYQAGSRSLEMTRVWLAAWTVEVFDRLPRRHTKGLREAVKRIEGARPDELAAAVDAVIAELLPRWLELRDVTGRSVDERYLDQLGD